LIERKYCDSIGESEGIATFFHLAGDPDQGHTAATTTSVIGRIDKQHAPASKGPRIVRLNHLFVVEDVAAAPEHPALALFRKWDAEPDSQSKEDWESLKRALDENRFSDRKLFEDESDRT
jgi:hypothetical protein